MSITKKDVDNRILSHSLHSGQLENVNFFPLHHFTLNCINMYKPTKQVSSRVDQIKDQNFM